MTNWTAAFALSFTLFAPLTAQAQSQDVDTRINIVGLGVAGIPEYPGADDYQAIPVFAADVTAWGLGFEFGGLGGRINLLGNSPNFRIGPALSFSQPRENVNDDRVDALDDVGVSVELGGFVGLRFAPGLTPGDAVTLDLSMRQDIAGAHQGFLITPSVDYDFALTRRLFMGLGLETTFVGGGYEDAYFSVDLEGAALSGLDLFDADAGIRDVGVSLNSIYMFKANWGAFGSLAYNRLLGDFKSSPIADDAGSADQFFAGLGIVYMF